MHINIKLLLVFAGGETTPKYGYVYCELLNLRAAESHIPYSNPPCHHHKNCSFESLLTVLGHVTKVPACQFLFLFNSLLLLLQGSDHIAEISGHPVQHAPPEANSIREQDISGRSYYELTLHATQLSDVILPHVVSI